ncbi:MAG: alpha/beta hydrolase [Candidatus Thorarchaeota archaeon]|nr:alpha/beta hydrolase [Candidatus Thorarchaeota archaeon]
MSPKQIIRYLLLILCYFVIGVFAGISFLYLFMDSSTFGWLIAMFYPSVAPSLFILVFSSGVIIIRFSFMKKKREMLLVSCICLFIFIGAIIPYAAIPSGIADAENQMLDVYGSQYSNLDTSDMRSVPYSLYDNLFGIPVDETKYSVEYNIRYLDNGQDSFFFDWYCPIGEGPFPVIIAIHGGAWVIGNKGPINIPLFNHYFASKGYVVCDINYGLFDLAGQPLGEFSAFSALDAGVSPDYNASYNIQDQIENIGYFTKTLELNSSRYKADMDNVFVVGRSAGGNMASLVTLGYKNPLFMGNFSSNMTIKGGVWMYPVTNITRDAAGIFDPFVEGNLPIEEQYKKLFAGNLISNSTVVPPIIIIHGSKDGLADYATQGLGFYQYAQSLGRKCVLITIPWAGHGFDYNFNGFGGQVSTFYIERFMALELRGI